MHIRPPLEGDELGLSHLLLFCPNAITISDDSSKLLFLMTAPIQFSVMYQETPSEGDVPSEELESEGK
jgi:hypothetical protein